jgi:hypothetical protein
MINFQDSEVRNILVNYLDRDFPTDRSQPHPFLVNQIREGSERLSYDSKVANQAEKNAQMARACIQLDKIRDAMKFTYQAIFYQEFSFMGMARFGMALNSYEGIKNAPGWDEEEAKKRAEVAAKGIWAGLFKNPSNK